MQKGSVTTTVGVVSGIDKITDKLGELKTKKIIDG